VGAAARAEQHAKANSKTAEKVRANQAGEQMGNVFMISRERLA
jgi:hypothetical protein